MHSKSMFQSLISQPHFKTIKNICLGLVLMLTLPQFVAAQVVYALSGNVLSSFDLATPTTLLSTTSVTGISAGQKIEGIDFRPNTGQLYAIGYNQTSGEARLYTINTISGAATAIGSAAVMLQPNMGEINFDFNPTVDRIRVTGSNHANYRLHPVTGAIAATDGALAYAAGDVNAGANAFITACAYSNSYIAASATTLYNYDASLNILTNQNPPNNGTLNTIGSTGLSVSTSDVVDMDIFFNAATQTNFALLSVTNATFNTCSFYSVNLTNGAATNLTPFPLPVSVDDIAILTNNNVPAQVIGRLVYALTANNNLISFDSELPSVIRSITPVSGVFASQSLVGLDFRPATGELYSIGYNNNSGMARLYTLNLSTGGATAVGMDSFMLQPGMGSIAFDFNPTVDRIRVTGSNDANFRLNPVTGAVAATDLSLAYAAGDVNNGANPMIGAVAYTNSFSGASTTTLYDYDIALNTLSIQLPPNNGTLNSVGSTGIMVNGASPTIDMDIAYGFANGANTAYLSANTGAGTNDQFFKINLTTGAATLVGTIGFGIPVKNMAVVLDPPPTVTFKAILSGHQQTFPVASAGGGEITASLTGTTLAISGSFSGLSSPFDLDIAGGAHIHSGFAGQSGPIELTLIPTPNLDSTGGAFLAALNTFQLTGAQLQLLKDRKLYINIHTHVLAGGEIRGQLLPASSDYFTTNLFGCNQNPGVLSNGSGALALELHNDSLVVTGSFAKLDGNFDANIAGGAHLHLGLPGGSGAIALELKANVDVDLHGGIFTAANNTFVLTADQKAALLAHALYANIHTDLYGSGEIRGQIAGTANAVFRAHLSGANQYPFVNSMGTGQVIAELKGNTLILTGSFSNLTSAVDTNIVGGAHLHFGLAGTNGGIAVELNADFDADGKGGVFHASNNTFTVDTAFIHAFLHRSVYINIHTDAFPSGEIKGQLLLESQAAFTAYLTGSQGIPDVITQAHGAVATEISGTKLTLSGSFTDLGSAINLAIVDGSHIHSGLPGSTGAVLFPLAASLDADLTSGTYNAAQNTFELTADQRTMLLNRGLYINIHTLLNPSGEIRGNFLAEAAEYFFCPLSGASQTAPVNVDAQGMLIAEVNTGKLILTGSFSGLENDFDPTIADGAHLHQQFAGSNGDVKIILDVLADADLRGGAILPSSNMYDVDADFIDSLNARMIYANIHTTGNAGGEIRGQLMPASGLYFHTSLAGINQAQAVHSNGSGSLKVELNGNVLTCSGSFNDLDGEFNPNIAGGAHIHAGATGASGGIELELATTLGADLHSGIFNASDNHFVLTNDEVDLLLSSELYANIHTTTQAGGEIRGQLLPEHNLFPDACSLTLPLPGANINVQGLPTDLLTINWTPSTDPDGDKVLYVLQIALDATFSNILYVQSVPDAPLAVISYGEIDALLAANGVSLGGSATVFARVIATDGSNATAGANINVNLKRGLVTGVNEALSQSVSATAQPNITSGTPVKVEISAQDFMTCELSVMTQLGQIIGKQTFRIDAGTQQFSVPFNQYAPGVYYLSLKTDQGTLPAMRVVKQ